MFVEEGNEFRPGDSSALPEHFADDDLASMALAADPDDVIHADAIPLSDVLGSHDLGLLPAWYMPSPMPRTKLLTGWKRRLAFLIITAFLVIDAWGLCSTYGQVVIAVIPAST